MWKEALDLPRVQVHRQHPVRARRLDQVGEQPRRDRHPRLVLLVRAPVGEVRHHRRDPPGRRPPRRVDHDQQLDQVMVDRLRPRLDQEHVALADVLQELHERVPVGEIEHVGAAQLHIQRRTHILRQLRMRVAREDHRIADISTHRNAPLTSTEQLDATPSSYLTPEKRTGRNPGCQGYTPTPRWTHHLPRPLSQGRPSRDPRFLLPPGNPMPI